MTDDGKKFNYCVGRPWPDPADGLCIYAYHTDVHHGTLSDARNFRTYVNSRTGETNFIYQLVKVE